jgi:hypothetical protein
VLRHKPKHFQAREEVLVHARGVQCVLDGKTAWHGGSEKGEAGLLLDQVNSIWNKQAGRLFSFYIGHVCAIFNCLHNRMTICINNFKSFSLITKAEQAHFSKLGKHREVQGRHRSTSIFSTQSANHM